MRVVFNGAMTLTTGYRLGPYEVTGPLGKGGMGEVYAARDTRLGRMVAIKVVPEAFARRFAREGRTLAAINHPNICTVHDVGPNYLVMELVEGGTLARVLKAGPLSIDDTLRYGAQIADALAAAHAHGIVHRDLKPGNVMIASGQIKVLDFGIATQWRPTDAEAETVTRDTTAAITAPGKVVGTPPYMSPAQADGRPVDTRSDVFAFGVVLYEMVCGRRPFLGETTLATLAATLHATPEPPRQLRHDVPRPLEQVMLRCLEKHPDARFRSGQDVREAFRALEARATTSSISIPRAAVMSGALVIAAIGALVAWRCPQQALGRATITSTGGRPEAIDRCA